MAALIVHISTNPPNIAQPATGASVSSFYCTSTSKHCTSTKESCTRTLQVSPGLQFSPESAPAFTRACTRAFTRAFTRATRASQAFTRVPDRPQPFTVGHCCIWGQLMCCTTFGWTTVGNRGHTTCGVEGGVLCGGPTTPGGLSLLCVVGSISVMSISVVSAAPRQGGRLEAQCTAVQGQTNICQGDPHHWFPEAFQ